KAFTFYVFNKGMVRFVSFGRPRGGSFILQELASPNRLPGRWSFHNRIPNSFQGYRVGTPHAARRETVIVVDVQIERRCRRILRCVVMVTVCGDPGLVGALVLGESYVTIDPHHRAHVRTRIRAKMRVDLL